MNISLANEMEKTNSIFKGRRRKPWNDKSFCVL